ncbi:hypothetical protein ACYKOH_005967 [Pseudomonas aeruginosa]
MSQHLFSSEVGNKKFEVIMGWDNPTKSFFLIIFDKKSDQVLGAAGAGGHPLGVIEVDVLHQLLAGRAGQFLRHLPLPLITVFQIGYTSLGTP